jgi:DNA-binding transcriptional ArsR family regulator
MPLALGAPCPWRRKQVQSSGTRSEMSRGRLAILRFVVQAGEQGAPAGDIQSRLELPASTLSHHLKRLLNAGLLRSRAQGTFHYSAAEYPTLRSLADYLWDDCCKRGKSSSC